MFPLGLIVASMFAKYMANQGAQDRQMGLQRSMEQYQRSKALQNESSISQMLAQQTPDKREAELQGINASRQGSMQQAVDQTAAAAPVSQAAGTNTSADYQKASTAAADTVSSRTKRAIQQLGLMGAPGEQALASGIRFGRTAGNVDANNAAIGNVGAGYMRDINNVHPDPFLSMVGDVGMGVGSGMVGNALGGMEDFTIPSQDFEDSAGNMQQSPAYQGRRTKLQGILNGWGFG